ncbi:MAG: asparagine synthase-related protein [Pirellulaceae bacterium]
MSTDDRKAPPESTSGGAADSPGKNASFRGSFEGQPPALIDRVVNLLDPTGNILLGTTYQDACDAVRRGDSEAVGKIRGQFAICQQSGKTIRMARSIGRPMRYFLAKRAEGPALIIAERIDEIRDQLEHEGLQDQFHAAYTRMVPAHHVLELQLVGCPDPNPQLTRYFSPPRNRLAADINQIGAQYIGRLAEVCDAWLDQIPDDVPIGVLFSGGIDSGSLVVVLDFLLRRRGQSPSRVKAFTLSVQNTAAKDSDVPENADAVQAREFLRRVNLEMILEVVHVPREKLSWVDAIGVIEDYKPLDVQAATMGLALLHQIRQQYPDWKFLIDGDGGDENLKDYPIEDNPELTVRSVLGNRMLYQEGWGVDAVKHSLTYSGGQSRGHVRTSAPATSLGFSGFSPYAVTDVIEIAEAIPFVELTHWDHQRLYQLKGQVVAAGVKAVTGVELPLFEKRRFQHGATDANSFQSLFPSSDRVYRQKFAELFPSP